MSENCFKRTHSTGRSSSSVKGFIGRSIADSIAESMRVTR